jgi:hypothetical protein
MKRLKAVPHKKYAQLQPVHTGDVDPRPAVIKMSAAYRFARDAALEVLPLLKPNTLVNTGMFRHLDRLATDAGKLLDRPASDVEALLVHLAEAQRLAERLRDALEGHDCDEDGRSGVCDRCGVLEALDETIAGANRHFGSLFVHTAPIPRVDLLPLPPRRRR